MMRFLAPITLGFAMLIASGSTAQTVSLRGYGPVCSFFGQTSTLAANYDARSRGLTLRLDHSTTCCNTFLSGSYLMVGLRPIEPGLPLPLFVPGCELAVLPVLTLADPNRTGVWSLTVPATLPVGATFAFQGVNDYFTTIGLSHDLQLSNGVELTILP